MSRTRRTAATAAAACLILIGTGSAALAAVPGANGVITGCRSGVLGTLRVIDTEAGQRCGPAERPLDWNQQGVRGPAGATGAAGPAGPAGPVGPAGPAGDPATKLFAYVDRSGVIDANRSRGAVSSSLSSEGIYEVFFDRDLGNCVYTATTEAIGTGFGIATGVANVAPLEPDGLLVITRNSGGQALSFAVNIIVECT